VNENPSITTKVLESLPTHLFKPVFLGRDVKNTERGSWVVDVSEMSPNDKLKLWKDLARAVERGSVGWVTVMLDDKSDLFRVWCWGGVVAQIWTMLYIVSDKRIKSGIKWTDSSGHVVIRM
jgi:hypothetical protein